MNALCLSLLATLPFPLAGCSEEGTPPSGSIVPSQFTRFVKHDDGSASLEVAIVRYEDEKGRTVDLVGAVHVGDPDYYDLLNDLFVRYDALLYEMIKARDVDVATVGKEEGGSLISQFQRLLKDTLGLEFQLDGIDYAAKNFVHADLDPATFSRLQKERGESILLLMLQAAIEQMKREATEEGAEDSAAQQVAMLKVLFSKDRARALKLMLGEQFGDLEKIAAGFEKGPRGEESVLVVARNKAALEVLEDQLEDGAKRLAIFYGAAHLPDLERRLLDELGFERKSQQWIPAWSIAPAPRRLEPGE